MSYLYLFAIAAFTYRLSGLLNDEELRNKLFGLLAAISLAGALTPSYWSFVIFVGLSLVLVVPRTPMGRICAFCFLLPVFPLLDARLQLGGFSIIYLTWPRLLTLVLLLPMVPRLVLGERSSTPVDKYVFAFFVIAGALEFRDDNFTAGVRGVFNLFLDMVLPYLVISRTLKTRSEIQRALTVFLFGVIFASMVNIVEAVFRWHLYANMVQNVTGAFGTFYEYRAGFLRAYGPLDRPSQSAFTLAVGLGALWMTWPTFKCRRSVALLVILVIAIGLFMTFSRGSWLGAILIGCGYIMTSNAKALLQYAAFALLLSIPIFALLANSEMADELYNLVPGLGDEDSQAVRSVHYRERLIGVSIDVANENPWFGSSTFRDHPSMNAMRQPNGQLDLVNHYLIVLLNMGYVGLLAFTSIFVSALGQLRRARREARSSAASDQLAFLNGLLFTTLAMLFAIVTTSATSRIGVIVWLVLGAIVASTRRGNEGRTKGGQYSISLQQ